MIKYVVFDLVTHYYLADPKATDNKYDLFCKVRFFATEEEAWKYVGIYCTVIKVRIN